MTEPGRVPSPTMDWCDTHSRPFGNCVEAWAKQTEDVPPGDCSRTAVSLDAGRSTTPHTCTGGDHACVPCLQAQGPLTGRSTTVEDEVDALVALSDAIRTLRERGWTVEPPTGTWPVSPPARTPS